MYSGPKVKLGRLAAVGKMENLEERALKVMVKFFRISLSEVL